MSFIALINNLALLLVLTIPYQYILRKWPKRAPTSRLATGFLFASLTLIGMKVSIPFAPGIIFDSRSVFISVGSLFGGPIVATITVLASASYRIYLGGAGTLVGIGVIVTSALIGLLFYHLRNRGYPMTHLTKLLLFGILVHVAMALWILSLPEPYDFETLWPVISRFLVILPLGTIILGKILADIEAQIESEDVIRQRDEQLEESEAHYRAIAEDISLLICRFKQNGIITYVNKAYCDFFGKKAEDLIGRSFYTLIPESDQEIARQNIAALNQNNPIITNTHRVISSTGEIRWQRWTDHAVLDDQNNIIAYQSVGEDITLQKQNEEELSNALHQLQLAVQTARLGIWQLDLQTHRITWNDELYLIYGIEKDDFGNNIQGWEEHLHPEDRAHAEKELRKIFDGERIFDISFRIKRPDGEIRHIQASGSPIYDQNENLVALIGINIDITNIKRNEVALKEKEEFLQAIFENSLNGIVVANDAGTYILANRAAANILGYPIEDLVGMNVSDLQTKEESESEKRYHQYIEKGKEIGEFEFIRPDGEIRIVQYHAVQIDTDFNLSILADVTERRRLENEERRANNLESLGLLAGGIAHDFNNILTGITGNLTVLEMLIEASTKEGHILQEAIEAARRTHGLTQQLMTFAKGGAPQKEVEAIQGLLQKTTLQSLRGANTLPKFDIAQNLHHVDVDLNQISQVIQNLVINADQAMPNGGTLTLSAQNIQISESEGIPLEPGPYIQICITDQGIGIPDNVIHQIFDPYFSTKDTGHGLGLSICHSIIKRHAGYITVQSEPGKGSTFTFYLPAILTEKTTIAESPTQIPTGSGKILILDDEEIIHKTVGRALTLLGYQITSAYHSQAALNAYQQALQTNTPFDVVIMDLTIPGDMGGKNAVVELLKIDPRARAIVSSGYSSDPVLTDPTAHGFLAAIQKPVDIKVLANMVQQVMHK